MKELEQNFLKQNQTNDKEKNEISQKLQNITKKYEEFYNIFEQEKKSYLKQSILAVKKDVSNILMQTISNLVNVLHFEEIDGHIQQAKEEIKKMA